MWSGLKSKEFRCANLTSREALQHFDHDVRGVHFSDLPADAFWSKWFTGSHPVIGVHLNMFQSFPIYQDAMMVPISRLPDDELFFSHW